MSVLVGSRWWVDGKVMKVKSTEGEHVTLSYWIPEIEFEAFIHAKMEVFKYLEPHSNWMSVEQIQVLRQKRQDLAALENKLTHILEQTRSDLKQLDLVLKCNESGQC